MNVVMKMNYRRYYPKGSKRKYVLNDEQFDELVKLHGFETAVDMDNACIDLVPENDEEALALFNNSCRRVLDNTKFYLEHLDKIPTFSFKYSILYEKMDKDSLKPKTL